MTLNELLQKVTVKDAVLFSAVGYIGYHLYNVREVLKVTVHRHSTDESKNDFPPAMSEVQLDNQKADGFSFGFTNPGD